VRAVEPNSEVIPALRNPSGSISQRVERAYPVVIKLPVFDPFLCIIRAGSNLAPVLLAISALERLGVAVIRLPVFASLLAGQEMRWY